MNNDDLINWFLALYARRTPPQSILDAHPQYRVTWHEIWAKMKELGYAGAVTDGRDYWQLLFEQQGLRRKVNRLLRASGEKPLPPRSFAERDLLKRSGEQP